MVTPSRLMRSPGRITPPTVARPRCTLSFCRTLLVGGGLALGAALGSSAAGWQVGSNLSLQVSLAVQELYDDNVFILDTRPAPGLVGPPGLPASRAKWESWVTSLTPGASLQWTPAGKFRLSASYTPEFVWYHNAPSENHVAHRATLTLDGQMRETPWEWRHQWVGIDGDHWGPVTLRPGDCRAIGGIPLRDRRDAIAYRTQWRATVPVQQGFWRPVASLYVHDFRTAQLPNPEPYRYIYDNFIDRWEAQGGFDIGLPVRNRGHFLLGYRSGHQHQGRLRGRDSPYANNFHRFLVGYEGSPWPWLKVALLAGPDLRDWEQPPPAFRQNEILYWWDASLTWIPTTNDTFSFRSTRFQQPAFTSHSVYEDIFYQLSWQHLFSRSFSVTASFTLYIGDWQAPAVREDWIYSPTLSARYRFSEHWEAECFYSHDTAVNRAPVRLAPYAEGREFNRNRLGVTLRYTF